MCLKYPRISKIQKARQFILRWFLTVPVLVGVRRHVILTRRCFENMLKMLFDLGIGFWYAFKN